MTQRAKEMRELASKIETRNPHSINEEYVFNQIERHWIVTSLRLAAQADVPSEQRAKWLKLADEAEAYDNNLPTAGLIPRMVSALRLAAQADAPQDNVEILRGALVRVRHELLPARQTNDLSTTGKRIFDIVDRALAPGKKI